MDIIQIKIWVQHHWFDLILLPGNLIVAQTIVMNAAQAHGYTKTASWCKKIGNLLSFIADIISGFLAKKQGGSNGKDNSTVSDAPKPTVGG